MGRHLNQVMEGHFYRRKMNEPHRQFGIKPRPLPEYQLPTNGDVIRRLLMVRIEVMEERSLTDERRVPIEPCLKKVTNEILTLWHRASLPTRSDQCVVKEVRKLWMKKENKRKVGGKVRKQKAAGRTVISMSSLFDISNRSREPELAADRTFLTDQRSVRQLQIGGLDRDTTSLWQRRSERAAQEAKKLARVDSSGHHVTSGTTTGSSAVAASLVGLSSGTASYSG